MDTVNRCADCAHYSAKVMLPGGGGNGKCWKIMDVTVTHRGSYGIVDAEFHCAKFIKEATCQSAT